MAHERTLMAWLRTSLAMISFGFTLRQFFSYLIEHEHQRPPSLFGPRGYGLTMMVMGIAMLALSSLQHAKALRRFGKRSGHKSFSLTLAFAFASLIVGVIALIATFLQG